MRVVDIGFDIDALHPNELTREFLLKEGCSTAFHNLLSQGVTGQFPQGIPLGKGKILARIQKKLQEMGPQDTLLDVEEAEYDLLKTVFMNDSTPFSVGQVALAAIFSEAVERAVKKNAADLKAVS